MSDGRTVVIKTNRASAKKIRVQPSTTPKPVGEQVEKLIDAIELRYDHYCKRIEHNKQCHALLKTAVSSGEFSQQEIQSLKTSVEEKTASIQPILEEIAEDIIAAQEAWHRKEVAIAKVTEVLDQKTAVKWRHEHDLLADRLDALIDKIKNH